MNVHTATLDAQNSSSSKGGQCKDDHEHALVHVLDAVVADLESLQGLNEEFGATEEQIRHDLKIDQ